MNGEDQMNQSPEMGGKSGKAWGWVVLIIIILLVIWGLFALGDNTEEADVPADDTVEEIENDLEETDVMMEEDGDAMEDIESEVETDVEAQ